MPLPVLSAYRVDRFPHTLENSCDKLPRSGLRIDRCQLHLELGGRQIAERRVQALWL